MTIDWKGYDLRLNVNGLTQRERNLDCLQHKIIRNLSDSLSYKEALVNNLPQSLLIIKTANGDIKQINSLPNETYDYGDYVEFGGRTYLVTDIDEDKEVYTQGKMQQCNFIIKFQSLDGAILSYPCIISTNSSAGISEGKAITVGDSIYTIKLPFDANTLLINVDRRFFIDDLNVETPQVFAVSKPNRTEFRYGDKGLIELTMKQDSYNSKTDRKDLGVCDYFEPATTLPPVEGYSYAKITCSNPSNEMTLGGSYRTLTPTFYNEDDTIAENITAIWTWIKPPGHDTDFTIMHDGNLAKIKVAENYDLIGMSVTANVMGSNGGYGGEITLTITL